MIFSFRRMAAVAQKELRHLFRDHRMRPILFVAPVIQLVILGLAANLDVEDVRFVVVDHDRTPVIYCIKALAEKHYGVNVEVVHIHERQAFEDALLDGRCDTIIEHIEYLYAEAARGRISPLTTNPRARNASRISSSS